MRGTAIAGVLFVGVAWVLANTVKIHSVAPASGFVMANRAGISTSANERHSIDLLGLGAPVVIIPLAVPVAGVVPSAIADSWGDVRENGLRAHHGTDIIAPSGERVLAAAPGTVDKLHQSAAGGVAIYVRSPDRQWSYYYAHLSNYAPGLYEGQVVQTGELIGFVGDSGNAGSGNYHLHFGLSHTAPSERWWQGTPINPYPSLAGSNSPG